MVKKIQYLDLKDKNINTKLAVIKTEDISLANWNYKEKGNQDQIQKLAASIQRDKSAGVLAVRILQDGTIESVDGNHRTQAIMSLGWKSIVCEVFENMSDAEAVLFAKRRNTQWFEDDTVVLADLMKNTVLPEISIDDMLDFMPDSRIELEKLTALASFDWSQFESDRSDSQAEKESIEKEKEQSTFIVSNSESDFAHIHLKMPKSVFEKWNDFASSYKTNLEAFESLLDLSNNSILETQKTEPVID